MTIQLFKVPLALNVCQNGECPGYVEKEALVSGRQIAKIICDDKGTPKHCFGNIQWSVRPYRVTDGCDGTRDRNAMLVCWEFCKKTGLQIEEIHKEAYPNERWSLTPKLKQLFEDITPQTEVPKLTVLNMKYLLRSMYSMNHRSFCDVLVEKWVEMGYQVEDYGSIKF